MSSSLLLLLRSWWPQHWLSEVEDEIERTISWLLSQCCRLDLPYLSLMEAITVVEPQWREGGVLQLSDLCRAHPHRRSMKGDGAC